MRHRDDAMLKERLFEGRTFDQIGARYGLSHEGARIGIGRATKRLIDGMERDLEQANAALAAGADPNMVEFSTMVVPFGRADEWQAALNYFTFVAGHLAARGWRLQVELAAATNGQALMLVGAREEGTS